MRFVIEVEPHPGVGVSDVRQALDPLPLALAARRRYLRAFGRKLQGSLRAGRVGRRKVGVGGLNSGRLKGVAVVGGEFWCLLLAYCHTFASLQGWTARSSAVLRGWQERR